jgi:hypothetical protein
MTMYDAPSDRDYAEYLNPQEPEGEDPDNMLPTAQPQELPNVECPF